MNGINDNGVKLSGSSRQRVREKGARVNGDTYSRISLIFGTIADRRLWILHVAIPLKCHWPHERISYNPR